jgi:hypothetical protein
LENFGIGYLYMVREAIEKAGFKVLMLCYSKILKIQIL